MQWLFHWSNPSAELIQQFGRNAIGLELGAFHTRSGCLNEQALLAPAFAAKSFASFFNFI